LLLVELVFLFHIL